jgi:hypothetical protein
MPLHRPLLLLRRCRIPQLSFRRHVSTTPTPAPPQQRSLVRRLAAPITTFLAFYGASQRAHPWITQIATSTTINALGDANAQLLSPSPSGYDPLRTLRMVLTGAALAIPVNAWYTRISYCFTTLPHMAAVLVRVALSQAIFTPVFLVGFFTVQGVLEGKSSADIVDKVQNTGPRAWRDGLVLWPAVSTLNFAVVPLEYRALVGGVASLGWNTWLSYLNAREGLAKAGVAPSEEIVAGAPMVAEVEKGVLGAVRKTPA